MPSPIEDYALIGDCQSAALIGKDGSIDWLCLPAFDSGACFAALLGGPENGRWQLAPSVPVSSVRRRYRDGTLVLETEYETEGGAVTVVDLMPMRSAAPDVLRMVIGTRGVVPMRMELVIRFDYGSVLPWVQQVDGGLQAIAGPDRLLLTTPVETRGEELKTISDFVVREGDRIPFVLTWTPSHAPTASSLVPEQAIRDTVDDWQNWSRRCEYQGPHAESVLRSLVTLKAMTYAPTGGLLAAPTTSLPEKLGGVRNWDYRFCWLRDATLTLEALMGAGYYEEASAWRGWLLRAIAGDPARLQVLYGLDGQRRIEEVELPWLAGYEGSLPVRTGNAASAQVQLDVYGEVMSALFLAHAGGVAEQAPSWPLQRALLDFLESQWSQPDQGFWEVRAPRRHFTHSKVMAWVAFDRGVRSVERFGLDGPVARWREVRDEIHACVCANGFDAELDSFVQYYGSKEPDASLLMIPVVGFLPASDARVRGTVAFIERYLIKDGLVARYRTKESVDGLPANEGVFLPCTFWLADNYLLLGRADEARAVFERLLTLRSDLGLLSEEYDPPSRRLLGNYPQAFSHVALVNTALRLRRHELGENPLRSD
jgi:GH15 family glucan-1,4-alpha-glucosidase